MKKILLTGLGGMLAHDFIQVHKDNYEIVSCSRDKLDITNMDQVASILSAINPDIIINLAAYTAVDDAEDVGAKLNYDVNTLGVYNLAKISQELDIDFITISSDYVFLGDAVEGYDEGDIENPLNAYGMAKYLGEKLAVSENKDSIIIRTSWLYGGGREFKNFVNTMIELGNKLDTLKVVNDQFGNPTYTRDLSEAIGRIIEHIEKYRGDIFHFSNQTEGNGISWYEFAQEIFEQNGLKAKLTPCSSSEFPTKASRPHFSKLSNNSSIQLRKWREGLREYLDNL